MSAPEDGNISTRKRRITKKEVMEFVEWAFREDIATLIYGKSIYRIAAIYKENTGKEVSPTFIHKQYGKWRMDQNGKVYKIPQNPQQC